MADFSNVDTKWAAYDEAQNIILKLKKYYTASKILQGLYKRYTDNVDEEFHTAVNALYTLEQRQEIGQMMTLIDDLVVDWETDHPVLVSRFQ